MIFKIAKQFLELLNERRQRVRGMTLVAMMAFGALLEALGIGLVMPFISLLENPEKIVDYPWVGEVTRAIGLESQPEIVTAFAVGLVGVFLVKNVYLAGMYYFQFGFIYENQVLLGRRLLDSYLAKPYTFHLQRNSAELLRNISREVHIVFNRVLIPLFTIAIEALVIFVVAGLLVAVEPVTALAAIGVLGTISVGFYLVVRKKIGELGEEKQRRDGEMIKWVNQALGGVKEVKTLARERFFVDAFESHAQAYADAVKYHRVVNKAPRFFIETLVVCGIVVVVLSIVLTGRPLSTALPILALFGMAAVRLMPSLTRIIASMTHLKHFRPALEVVLADLKGLDDATLSDTLTPTPDKPDLEFADAVDLDDIWYRYPEANEYAIEGLNLRIDHGSSVALVGPSGSGKTTTVDILIGLLEPEKGAVRVDGRDISDCLRAWRQQIGYIAQSTYLTDDTIKRNVAFGLHDDDIDDDRVWDVLQAAHIADFVENLDDGLNTVIGEDGVRFSGGQQQRLGIARALYHDPQILVLDEATSAVDNKTEREINRAIGELKGDKTFITIAHRLATVKHSDCIYFLDEGRVSASGTYEELIQKSSQFRELVESVESSNQEFLTAG